MREIILVLASAAFFIHIWAYYAIAYDVPAWILYYTTEEFIARLAYTFAFLFAETLATSFAILAIGFFLPKSILQDKFVSISTMVMLSGFIFSAAHTLVEFPRDISFLPFLGFFGFALIFVFLLYLYPMLNQMVFKFIENLVTLSILYLLIDLAGIIIVLLRNI